jgi:hypothetical protein
MTADHFQRVARQPAKRLLHVVQRWQQIRPPARIRSNAFGKLGVRVHDHGF